MKMSWSAIEAKQGEDISHYVHSFEDDRDSNTNLKLSEWASPTTIQAVVRSQPTTVSVIPAGILETEVILVLTNTSIANRDRFLWNSEYWEALQVDQIFYKGTRQYYKARCTRVVGWDPPT